MIGIKILTKISRPRFWTYLGGTFLVGSAFGVSKANQLLAPLFWVNLIYFTTIANILLYGINDYFDEETDKRNKKKGEQEHLLKSIEKDFLKKTIVTAVLLSALVLLLQPFLTSKLIFLIFLLLSVYYSAPPLRFKARPYLDFTSNLLYILPGLVGYYNFATQIPPIPIILALFFWAFAMHLFSAIPDIQPDKAAGVHTTAVLLGKTKSLFLCILFWSLSALLLNTRESAIPLSLVALVYPFIPTIIVLNNKLNIMKIYWIYPYINGIIGAILFFLALRGK